MKKNNHGKKIKDKHVEKLSKTLGISLDKVNLLMMQITYLPHDGHDLFLTYTKLKVGKECFHLFLAVLKHLFFLTEFFL